MATAAQYASVPVNALPQVSAANTARDGTGTLVTVLAGATTGTRIDDLTIKAVGATTAGMIRLYLSLDGGTTNRLLTEIPVTAATPTATVTSWATALPNMALVLQNANAMLRASTEKAEVFNLIITRAGAF